MILKIIHYCWFGGNPLPDLEQRCLASWHQHMPDWEYRRWDEDSLTRALNELPIPNPYPKGKGEKRSWLDYVPTYVKQAYEAKKFAFVSDYVRLWALEQYGGLYMDVDFEVFRPFDDLMDKYPAFAGYEGSKRKPVMPFEMMFAAYGLSIAVTKAKYKRWFTYWCGLMFVAAIAWNWFKLAGRGLA